MDTHKPNTVQDPNDLTESDAKELEKLFNEQDTDNNINPKEEKQKDSKQDSSKDEDESGDLENDESKKEDEDLKKEKEEDKNWEIDYDFELKKQSANSQRKIQEKHNRILKAETKLVENNPEHFLELAKWDSEDKKIAKDIAKNLYNTSLWEAVKELSSDEDLSPEQIAENLAEEKFRKKEVDQIKNSFLEDKEILDKGSEKFNEETYDNFLDIYNKLTWEKGWWEKILDNEEIKQNLDNAYFLINRKNYEANIEEKLLEKIKLESVKNKISNSWTSWWTQWGWEKKWDDDWYNKLWTSN